MAGPSSADKKIVQDKIKKVVTEFKDGTLRNSDGGRVLNFSQALEIGIEKGKAAAAAAKKGKK